MKIYATFNGKEYSRLSGYFKTKTEAKNYAKKMKKKKGRNIILDKSKRGHFLWVRDKDFKI